MTLDQYKLAYEEAMRQQGVKVTWMEDGQPGGVPSVGGWNNPDNWVATLSRDGVTTQTLVTQGRMNTATPDALAAYDITYALKFKAQRESPQGELPSSWFLGEDDDTRRFYELYPYLRPGYKNPIPPPGPPPTVPVGNNSSVPRQTADTPNNGTQVPTPSPSPTASSAQLTFWQWNYYWQQQTGRSGPDPGEVGVLNGNMLMTGQQWVDAVGGWYGTEVSIPKISGPSGGVGGTQTGGSVPVGGTGTTPSTPGTGAGGGSTPVGGTTTPAAPSTAGKNTFWTWNALYEQQTGIVGDDPANYDGITGNTLLTKGEWETLTAPYYAAQKAKGGGSSAPADNTMLYLGAAALALVILARKG